MKNLKLGLSAVAITVASTAFAQTTNNPWLIGVGAHGVNHVVGGGGLNKFFDNLTSKGLYSVNNYTITPPLSKLTVARNLSKGLVLDWQTTVGNVDNKRFGMGKEFMLMTGLGLQFKFASLWDEESWFDPYVRVGANYLRHDYTGLKFPRKDLNANQTVNYYDNDKALTGPANHFTASGGLGSNFWLSKNFGLGIQGDYVTTPGNKSDVANFWQASASVLFRFGNRDKDKDGILDKDDRCPETPGLAEFQGCPDTDGDGIPDIDDTCPDVAGPVENNGCPWPDTDGDDVIDKDDNCVNVPGPAENAGCPWPDTDGDDVLDKDDKCPTVPGLPEYNGCPKPESAYAEETTGKLQGLLFDFDKATIRSESYPKLDEAATVIRGSQTGRFLVEGHTDAKGSESYNLDLSRRRAASVVQALEARGVNPMQLKSVGLGESAATVSESASDEARMADRKVIVRAIDATAWEALQKSDLPVVEKKVVKKKRSTSRRR